MILYPRVHPCPLETCGCVASFDKPTGDLTVYITSQAPHVVRTVVALLSGIPERKIRIIAPRHRRRLRQQGWRVSGLCHRRSSLRSCSGGRSSGSRSRIENISTTASRATITWRGELAADKRRPHQGAALSPSRPTTARSTACAVPTKWPAGMFQHLHRLLCHPQRVCRGRRRLYQQIAGGVAYRCSFRVTEAVYLIERMIDVLAQKLGIDKAEIRLPQLHPGEQFPYTTPLGLRIRLRRLSAALEEGAEGGRLPRRCAREQAARRADPKRASG